MRHFDFSTLCRATVGFEQIANLMYRVLASDGVSAAYATLDTEKIADDAYSISIAVAGFSADDINVYVKENELFISAGKNDAYEGKTYLHRGIANRTFGKCFQLTDHVRVETASQIDRILHVDLIREVLEGLKPRCIEIMSATTKELPEKAFN